MINYGKMTSTTRPLDIQITDTSVFIAKNIEEVEKDFEGVILHTYVYDYIGYTKDEYLLLQAKAIGDLEEELRAAKIILGVE